MTTDSIWSEIKQVLSGRPGQPIVLGVCQALAQRLDKEVWCIRLAALIIGMLWALPALACYILLGFFLPQTEARTRDFFAGLGIVLRESADRLFNYLGKLFGSQPDIGSRRHG